MAGVNSHGKVAEEFIIFYSLLFKRSKNSKTTDKNSLLDNKQFLIDYYKTKHTQIHRVLQVIGY